MRYYPKPMTRDESRSWVEWNQRLYRSQGFGLWAMVLRDTGEFAGDCGLTPQYVDGIKEIEVGYHVCTSLQGNGYATEAAAAARSGIIYEAPGGGYVTAEEYLSGNVRLKLREAEAAAQSSPRFEANVAALSSVLPAPLEPGEITARLQDRVEELESKAYELADEEFMLGSTQQVARILFEKLRLTPGRKGKTGYSTDTRVLRTIRGEHEIVGVIEEWRELTKLINTYLGPLPALIGADGRLHTTFNQAVAATGRLSTSNPNLQAIPIRTELGREIRSAFVAEPGHKLVSADYSQI